MQIHTSSKDLALNTLVCASMMFLYVGGVAYVIIHGSALEERYGKTNLVAYQNLYEAFILDTIFLVTPFLGGCSAFRLVRSRDRSGKIVGWLFAVLFALLFFQSAMIEWTQYRNYLWLIGK